jgi:hypothetical protein
MEIVLGTVTDISSDTVNGSSDMGTCKRNPLYFHLLL